MSCLKQWQLNVISKFNVYDDNNHADWYVLVLSSQLQTSQLCGITEKNEPDCEQLYPSNLVCHYHFSPA